MTTTPIQELTPTLSNDRLPIEDSAMEPAAFVLLIGSEMIRQGQTRAEVELTRRLYRRLASEKNLQTLLNTLVSSKDCWHVADSLRIASEKLCSRRRVRYFIRFALDPA